MSDHSTGAPTFHDPPAHWSISIKRSWTVATIVAVAMVMLALLGVALSTAGASIVPAYWISLVPVYGVLCVGTAWSRAGAGGRFERALVVRQVLHWLGIAVALGTDYYLRGTGKESGVAAGLNALLLLALGCYLAGVHLAWLFSVVGGLLTLTVIIVAKAEKY